MKANGGVQISPKGLSYIYIYIYRQISCSTCQLCCLCVPSGSITSHSKSTSLGRLEQELSISQMFPLQFPQHLHNSLQNLNLLTQEPMEPVWGYHDFMISWCYCYHKIPNCLKCQRLASPEVLDPKVEKQCPKCGQWPQWSPGIQTAP